MSTRVRFFQVIWNVQLECHELVSISQGKSIQKVSEFLNSHRLRGHSKATLRTYAYALKYFYEWMKTEKKVLKRLVTADFEKWIDFQRQDQLLPRSINLHLSVSENFYRFAQKEDLSPEELDRRLKARLRRSSYRGNSRRNDRLGVFTSRNKRELKNRVKIPKTLIQVHERQQVFDFLKSLKTHRNQTLLLLMALCGLRASETLGLRIGSIDFERKVIRVNGKGNREREIPLVMELSQSIQNYIILERPKNCSSDALMLVSQGKHLGQPLCYEGLRSLFRYYRKKLNQPHAHPHSFRHWFGSQMIQCGASPLAVQKLLGHAYFNQTEGYIHVSSAYVAEEFGRAIEKLKKIYATQTTST